MTDERWQRIERLYHAALERRATERAAFLDAACADDDALKLEVASLLASDDEAQAFLETPAIHEAAMEFAEAAGQSLVGRRLGSYELLARLGAGGMGEVYRARDVRLDRIVAIKVLAPHLADEPDFRHRFEREARTISQLSHPHICTLHDIGHEDPPADSGQALDYLVLEYLDGETLADRLRRGSLPLDQALKIAIEIGEALEQAHRHSVVHRDLKPGNIMLTESGAKLLDFGLAKRRPASPIGASHVRGDPSVTQTGAPTILGTLPYMAPEQLEGKEADARADLWALGAVLYEMLTGTRAFDGDSEAQIIGAVVEREPELLTSAQLATPPELERLVRGCLAKRPDDRWATAHDIVVQLRGIAEHRAGSARRRPAAPRRMWAAAAIATVLATGAMALLFRPRAPVAANAVGKPSIAVLYFENHTGNASLDWLRTGLADMVVTDLSQSPDVEVLGTDQLYQILGQLHHADDRIVSFDTVQEIARRANVRIVVLGGYVKAADAIRINITLQDASSGRIIGTERVEAASEAQLFSAVDDLTRKIKAKFAAPGGSAVAGDPASTGTGVDRDLAEVTTSSIEAYRYYAEGVSLHERGRDVDATAQLRRAVQLDPGFAMAFAKLATTESIMGDLEDPGNQAAAARDSQQAMDHSSRLPARERLYIEGGYYMDLGEIAKAIEAYTKLLALNPDHISSRNNLGLMYSRLERYQEAVDDLEVLRRRGVMLSAPYDVLAHAYELLGQTGKSVDVLREFLGRNPDNGRMYWRLGDVFAHAGKTDDALAAFAKAEALTPALPGIVAGRRSVALLRDQLDDVEAVDRKRLASHDVSERRRAAIDLADDRLFRGRTADALKLLAGAPDRQRIAALLLETGQTERALAEGQRSLATERPIFFFWVVRVGLAPASLSVIARAQARLGHPAEAAHAIERIASVADSIPSHFDQRTVHWLNGRIALDQHDTATALRELTQAQTMLPPADRGIPIWFALGSAYLAVGKDADAALHFQRIVDSPARTGAPLEFVRSLYFLGQIADRQGDRDKSRAYYRRFVDYWGDGDIDRERVADARRKIAS